MMLRLTSVFFSTLCFAGLCFPQEQIQQPAFPPAQATYHLLRQAAHINEIASSQNIVEKLGSGESLKQAICSTLSLGDADAKAFFALALSTEAQFADLDARAAKVIAEAKTGAKGGVLPPPPVELIALRAQKLALISTLGSSILQSLSPDGFKNVARYLQHSSVPSALRTEDSLRSESQ